MKHMANYEIKDEVAVFHEGVTMIKNKTFKDCTWLKGVIIPASVTEIEANAFCRCTSLESIVVLEGNPVYDSRESCNAIIETKTNTLTSGCKSTVSPESVVEIGKSAFSGCT
ncbi:MAG: leucine-rich repeat protein, partial [Bacteroidaceae bacterium]|nr:leucine-rich repeat protein [Bacteroidaceae bacterium]